MSKPEDFLVEVGTEELPPNELQNLSFAFASSIQKALEENGISYAGDKIQIFATPRRIAVLIPQLATEQPAQLVSRRGPAISLAYNPDGSATKAAIGFAQSCGVTLDQLSRQETDKGQWLYFEQTVAGKKTIDILPSVVENALQLLPIKKRMRWGSGDHAFVRPIQWILMLFGSNTIKTTIWGISTGNITFGHRIHCKDPIKIDIPKIYADKLEQEGFVIAEFTKRKQIITDEINALAAKENGSALIDPNLLDLVTGLVEYPIALLANFNKDFLRVPKECLISAMQDHQKCFAILDANGKLLPKFILISNLKSTDPDTVIRGNELVMHARLADAQFHFDNDLKHSLASRVEKLGSIVYQKQLGSLYDKVCRIQQLASFITKPLEIDINKVERAAYLCKADLVTSMVYEFPELQGIMGYYYALNDNESTDVALAIADHYKPRSAQDTLPTNKYGIALAIADRVDTLVGFFGIDLIPTGEKDPYALRRQALAVLRILIEKDIDLNLYDLFTYSATLYANKIKNNNDALMTFCFERLRAWYLANGVSAKTFEAVLFAHPHNPLDFNKRIYAVESFQRMPAAINLAAANKRVQNLLEKCKISNDSQFAINAQLISEPEEKQLLHDLSIKESEIAPLMQDANYTAVLQSLASLQTSVDNFFDKVMVMVEDEQIRTNRLNLLQRLRNLFLQVADISLL